MFSKIHEECGVFGIYSSGGTDVAGLTYSALFALQHRGQESCGIAVNDDGVISGYKDLGLVGEVFPPERLQKLGGGQLAVGHVRYATTGRKSRENAQPLIINHIKGSMALAHNGNLTNAAELREALELNGAIFHTTSDTEVIAYTITNERLRASSIEEAVSAAMDRIKGAYSLVIMSPQKLIAVRDPHGFRPLCIGRLGDGWVFASESCALDGIGAQFVRDVRPGEIVIADKGGLRSITTHCGQCPRSLCVFEYIYFARPDSVMDAALGYSKQSGIPYGVGFIKNKYIARTFIQPEQSQREKSVNIKLNTISSTIRGKRVVLIDDSIVRGTTCAHIVKLVREAGATEVHMRVSAPPFLNPCYFGTDVDSRENLIACSHTIPEIAQIIGVDSLGYLSTDSVTKLAECGEGFCTGCFTGEYPVEVPEKKAKFRFERGLSEKE